MVSLHFLLASSVLIEWTGHLSGQRKLHPANGDSSVCLFLSVPSADFVWEACLLRSFWG